MPALEHALAGFAIGDTFLTATRTIEEADVVDFSRLTGDWHPQHLDAAWAAQTVFGQRIAHGMLVLGCAVGLLELDPARVVALTGLRRLSFKRPVALGTTIRVRGAVADLRPVDGDLSLVTLSFDVLAPERVAVRGSIEALVRAADVGS